jgi:hypothetical protein
MNRKLTMVLLLVMITLVGVQGAWARSQYLSAFDTKYSTTSTRLDTCTTCHNASFADRNPYGRDVESQLGGATNVVDVTVINAALTSIEPLDSDKDGFINIDEIHNLTFPGNGSDHPIVTVTPTFNISGFKINNATGIGVQGWNITLKNTTMQTSMLTGADGSYKFVNLVNGTYNVSEELQAGWTNVSPMSQQVTINGADKININFTNQPPTPVGINISGFKINDTNGNGVWNPGELGIENWNIMLLNDTGVQLANTSTDASGFYQFMNILPGDYNVAEEMKTGFTPTNAVSVPVTVENMDVTNVNFTNQVTVPQGTFNISGFKVNDTNGNNVWETGEMGIENWNIMLLNDTGAQIASTSTNASGFYEFMDLAPGVYNVTEEMKAGFTPSGATFKVVTIENMDVTDVDFLNHVKVPAVKNTISGFKINDLNGNGKQDAGENGLPGWKIQLIGIVPETVDINKQTTTDDQGFYSFEDLPAGMYLLVETLKEGYVPSGPPVLVVTLENGKNSMNNNFMNRPISSLIPDLSGLLK